MSTAYESFFQALSRVSFSYNRRVRIEWRREPRTRLEGRISLQIHRQEMIDKHPDQLSHHDISVLRDEDGWVVWGLASDCFYINIRGAMQYISNFRKHIRSLHSQI